MASMEKLTGSQETIVRQVLSSKKQFVGQCMGSKKSRMYDGKIKRKRNRFTWHSLAEDRNQISWGGRSRPSVATSLTAY